MTLNTPNIYDFNHLFLDQPSLHMRSKEARKRSKQIIRRSPGTVLNWGQRLIEYETSFDLDAIIQSIDDALSSVASRPYSAPEIRQLLNISNQERLRWTKDGRLKQGRSQMIRKGQNISIMTYDIEAANRLLEEPDTTEEWREGET